MDKQKSVAPLMTRLAELKRLSTAEKSTEPKYVICNQHTAQQLAKEAQTINKMVGKEATIVIDDLLLVVHPQDPTQNLVMEVV